MFGLWNLEKIQCTSQLSAVEWARSESLCSIQHQNKSEINLTIHHHHLVFFLLKKLVSLHWSTLCELMGEVGINHSIYLNYQHWKIHHTTSEICTISQWASWYTGLCCWIIINYNIVYLCLMDSDVTYWFTSKFGDITMCIKYGISNRIQVGQNTSALQCLIIKFHCNPSCNKLVKTADI